MQRMLKENYLERKRLLRGTPNCSSAKSPARQSDRERIFIRAIGLVNQDIAMARSHLPRALEKGIGTKAAVLS
jgi:ornithine cyclodeaminase/alanine dehydrogenase-like protein (mu-crystallin family)